MNKLRVLELFGGIGACSKALERLGIEYEIADYVEIDKYAVASYNAMHDTNFEPQDICKWDKDIEVDLVMHGSPCQDFSLAGLQAGGDEGSGTRSSLMYETIRIVKKLKPKYIIWENVKNLLSKKHRHNFDAYLEIMESLGYKNYYQVLNAKDYGIPQNRERVFTISIRNDIDKEFIFPEKQELKLKLKDMLEDNVDEKYYLSDDLIQHIQKTAEEHEEYTQYDRYNGDLEMWCRVWKNKSPTLNTKCRDTKIYIKNATKKGYLETTDGDGIDISSRMEHHRETVQKGKIQTLTTQCDRGVVINDKNIYNLFFTIFDLCCTIDTKEKDKYERSRELLQILWEEIGKKEIWQEIRRFIGVQKKKILQSNLYENELYEDRELQSRISSSPSNSEKHNESITNREKMFNMWKEWKIRYTPQRWELSEQQFRQFNLFMQELSYETAQGETSMQDMWETNERFRVLQQTLFEIQEIWRPIENKISNGLRIRKLSPLECWRLMGFDDEDFEKASKVNSNAQLYKQAGNSIVVNVLMAIFNELLKKEGE